jgi:hypothetical protein
VPALLLATPPLFLRSHRCRLSHLAPRPARGQSQDPR